MAADTADDDDTGRRRSRKRDQLIEMEQEVRKLWDENHVFDAEARDQPPKEGEKFFGTFPFPYMNGFLHLGHAFSLSKVEFAASYHRLRGANVLLPFAFHCTGMPIKASADKLRREVEKFGYPPVFPPPRETETEPKSKERDDMFKGGKKKSKVASKNGRETYQWEIMRSFGLSDAEIYEFQDPAKWLLYFPPLAVEDLKAFGLGADWRRSFITTDLNPFFDKFVRWQMRKLYKLKKIFKDKRYTIYSPLDGQPCADHDRASGEGVIPQEYTLIKMEILPPFPPNFAHLLQGEGGIRKVYLAAATLRPETLYGQTNSWVLPDGKYGAFEINESEVFILTQRAARNLAFQRKSRVPEKATCIVELTGQDLIGLPLRSPLALNTVIRCLPMLSVLIDKGTGIVTSVPSDSPDDYMALEDLKAKASLRAKFGVKDEWVLPLEAILVISHPEFGDKSAERICTDMKIKRSQNERERLVAAAKKLIYAGTMIAGEYAGMPVEDARNKIREKLLDDGQAVEYWEPENKVVSRSGDECVVALTDQWYLNYGEESWLEEAKECLANMNLYSDETRHGFEHTLSWLKQWACSRSFGLGTRLPWDEEFLVESLSDSTIYMAYYTVCHLIQNGDLFGTADTSSLKPEQLTDDVWDYVFLSGPEPKDSDISHSLVKKMRQEFRYWYPVDLRVSGKDLIQNHLTFCIYNHTAIFRNNKEHWPRGFRCNGHITLNSLKMSKSTGNFRTLKQAIEEFSADATRFALADAGDGMDDGSFEFGTANKAILRLTKERGWMEELLLAAATDQWSALRAGPPSTFADRVFANEMNFAIQMTEKNYSDYMFKEALITGFHNLQNARDEYRLSCESSSSGNGMNRDLLWRFMDIQTRLIAPICPHYSEYVWRKVLKKDGFVIKAGWPEAENPDLTLQEANRYLQQCITNFRKQFRKQAEKKKKGKPTTAGLIFVNEEYDGWKRQCLIILRDRFDSQNRKFASDKEMLEALQQSAAVGQEVGDFKRIQELCMPFLKDKKDDVLKLGIHALDLRLPFAEIEVLQENLELIKRQTGLERAEILPATESGHHASFLKQSPPSPGSPTLVFLAEDG